MYVCMYVCQQMGGCPEHVSVYLRMCACVADIQVCKYVCMHVCQQMGGYPEYLSVYLRMCAYSTLLQICKYVCMHVCISTNGGVSRMCECASTCLCSFGIHVHQHIPF
jgi:hypothetical protein